jgi:hypothetical protein
MPKSLTERLASSMPAFKPTSNSIFNQPSNSTFKPISNSGFNQPSNSGFNQSSNSGFNQPSNSTTSSFLLTSLRYIGLFWLVSFLIIAILIALDILPPSLGNIYNSYRKVKKPSNKETKDPELPIATAINYPNKKDKSYNIPEVKKIAQRREVSAPTRLPQAGNPLPKPDNTGSKTQAVQATKSGFCYIGEDRGFRSCVPVKGGDKCMSGDIFPTQAICINPNLRA